MSQSNLAVRVLLLALPLALAGCGGDSSKGTGNTGPTAPTEGATVSVLSNMRADLVSGGDALVE